MLCATAFLSSCHIYKSYDRPEDIEISGLYRDTVAGGDTLVSDTTNFGNLPWREVFTDSQLQTLIEQGLANNTDLQTAILKVKEAQAALMTSRLAYAPMLALSPQGTISSFDKSAANQTYSLPVTASWELDLFGNLLNAKRGSQVALLQTKAYRQAVQTQIISGIANTYYTLLMLDKQLEISEQTADVMKLQRRNDACHERCRYDECCRRCAKRSRLCAGYRLSTGYPSKYPRSRKRPLHAFKTSTASYQTQHIGRAAITHTILCWRTFAAIIQSSGRESRRNESGKYLL